MQRYLCRACKRSFGALTGAGLSRLHHKEVWLTFGQSFADGGTVKASAERYGIAVSTAFWWPHRFLAAIKANAISPAVIADAIRAVLAPVLDNDPFAAFRALCARNLCSSALLVTDGGTSYPPCAAALDISHEALNQSTGGRVRGELHIRTVSNRHSCAKDFLRARCGIATRDLDSCLRCFHLIGLHPDEPRDTASLPLMGA